MKRYLALIFCILIMAWPGYAGAISGSPIGGGPPLNSPQFIDTPAKPFTINSLPVSRVLCQSTVANLLYNASGWSAAPTSSIQMASCAVPAGAMGLNGALRISSIWTVTNSSNTKYEYALFGGQQIAGMSTTAYASYYDQRTITNRNSASSQIGGPTGGNSVDSWTATANFTASVNTANATTITFNGQTSLETGISQTALSGNGTSCSATVASGAYAIGDEIIVASGTGCGSGNQNSATPVAVTASNGSTTYSYPCTCNGGTPANGSGQRYSRIQLEAYTVELIPGAN